MFANIAVRKRQQAEKHLPSAPVSTEDSAVSAQLSVDKKRLSADVAVGSDPAGRTDIDATFRGDGIQCTGGRRGCNCLVVLYDSAGPYGEGCR